MKHLVPYRIFESLEENQISISEFLQEIQIPHEKRDLIVDWWNQMRSNIRIYYFPFNTPHPIAGVFLETDAICVNSKMRMPPHIRLFLALHESRHCDQHRLGTFASGYYDTVVSNRLDDFLEAYTRLEKDANDFAIDSMRKIGFEKEMNQLESGLRKNEEAGPIVFKMMQQDIASLQATDMFDLLKKQIL